MQKIIIQANDINQRLDNFLVKVFPHISKTLIFRLIRTKKIKINNKKTTPDYRLNLNDEILIYYQLNQKDVMDNNERSETYDFLEAKDDISIIYEDQNLIVVNKPTKLVVHSDINNTYDTLINRVQKYLYLKKEFNPALENQFAPSLVHRIDQNTAGLIIIAKNYLALQTLNEIFKNHEIDKHYLALVYGKITPLKHTINLYIKKEDKFVKVYKEKQSQTKEAITHYTVIDYLKNKYSLIDVLLFTGRTHQIRASFNFLGYPLVGEQKYITKNIDKDLRFKYQCLCAYKIKFKINNKTNPLYYLNNIKLELPLKQIWFLKTLT